MRWMTAIVVAVVVSMGARPSRAQPFFADSGYYGADQRRAFEYRHQLAEQQQAYARAQAENYHRRQAYGLALQQSQGRARAGRP